MDTLIKNLSIPDFPNSTLQTLELNSTYYSLSSLANTLGYSSPNSLIQSVPSQYKLDFTEIYAFYLNYMDNFPTFIPLTEKGFKKELSQLKPFWFTTLEGVSYILSKNTFTIPRLKTCIAQALGLNPIAPPHKESVFYDALLQMLKDSGLTLNRHLYLAGYFADIEIQGCNPPIIVEYDENNHRYYDQEKEKLRERIFNSLGYKIIRVNDSVPPIEAAASLFKQILPTIP